jgi:hypothetical protein
MSDWMAMGIGRYLARDLAIGALLYLIGSAWLLLAFAFLWPLIKYSWHYWAG